MCSGLGTHRVCNMKCLFIYRYLRARARRYLGNDAENTAALASFHIYSLVLYAYTYISIHILLDIKEFFRIRSAILYADIVELIHWNRIDFLAVICVVV